MTEKLLKATLNQIKQTNIMVLVLIGMDDSINTHNIRLETLSLSSNTYLKVPKFCNTALAETLAVPIFVNTRSSLNDPNFVQMLVASLRIYTKRNIKT